MTSDRSSTPNPEWPTCEPAQVQVMLLGTYHMDNPGLDEANVEADDVLSADRQAELRELVDHLANWKPDRVAVERPYDRGEEVNYLYGKYRSSEFSYGREERFPSPHPMRNDPVTECRSEVIQVGFRLAETLDHGTVISIDEHPEDSRYDSDPFAEREIDPTRKTSVSPQDLDHHERESNERLASSTIPAYLRWLNDEEELSVNHDAMFDRAIRGTGERFGSPLALVYWYDRNIRMVHHLWQQMASDDERILLLVGSGHVRVLRHLLREAPIFCPVSPLPYLS